MKHRLFALVLVLLATTWQALASTESAQISHQGLKLNANLVAAGQDWQQGRVVLMTHGTLAHGRMEIMDTLQSTLKDRGVSSLALTLSLGLSDRKGMYDCNTPHTHRHADALEEIDLWVNWLKQQGVEEIVLFGHSRGGNQTAWYAVERDQPMIKGSMLLAPMMWAAEYDARDYQTRYQTALAPILKQTQALIAAGKQQTMLDDVDFIYCKDTQATAGAFAGYYGHDPRRDTPTLLPKLAKPVVVFVGTEDKVVQGLAEKVMPLADGKRIQVQEIDGADHFFRDLYAEDVADLMVEFMQQL